MTVDSLMPFFIAIIGGGGYGIVWWITQYFDPTKPTTRFQIQNLLLTMAYGAGLGAFQVYLGNPLNQTFIEGQLLANAALVAGAQRAIQTVWRWVIAKLSS